MSSDTISISDTYRREVQGRTLKVLFASAIFGRAAMSIGFVVSALIMADILGSSTWAGASTAAITIGTAFSASSLANYMARKGRRPGLALGYAAAAVGGAVAVIGSSRLALVPFLIGLVLIGIGQGGTNLARYAAADLAEPSARSKAISYVVFASTIGAVGGPALAGIAGDVGERFGYDELVGPFGFAA
ncbi:MAG: MFS transporter, partial [Acidimicrobiales bacterium]